MKLVIINRIDGKENCTSIKNILQAQIIDNNKISSSETLEGNNNVE